MHILLAAAEIRTHEQQNYEILKTGAPAPAAMTPYGKLDNYT